MTVTGDMLERLRMDAHRHNQPRETILNRMGAVINAMRAKDQYALRDALIDLAACALAFADMLPEPVTGDPEDWK